MGEKGRWGKKPRPRYVRERIRCERNEDVEVRVNGTEEK